MAGGLRGPGRRRVALAASPLADDGPVEVHVRSWGEGFPLVFLHGGWGYDAYPFDAQADALAGYGFGCLAPDRAGYGASARIAELPPDFHQRAARETLAVMDAMGVERAALWGHSDGAVIAAWMAIEAPTRVDALVLEALHLWRDKPASRAFFEAAATDPAAFGRGLAKVLEADYGPAWHDVIRMNGRIWLRLADEARDLRHDLFEGRLKGIRAPTLLLHGARDPRTEPGELDAVQGSLPHARLACLEDGGHSPHSERATADEVTRIASAFLRDAIR